MLREERAVYGKSVAPHRRATPSALSEGDKKAGLPGAVQTIRAAKRCQAGGERGPPRRRLFDKGTPRPKENRPIPPTDFL